MATDLYGRVLSVRPHLCDFYPLVDRLLSGKPSLVSMVAMVKNNPDPKPPLDPRPQQAMFWLYLAMGIGVILPGILYVIFGTEGK